MRLLIIVGGLTLAIGLSAVVTSPTDSTAATSECSGENCPPPAGGGGHECERKSKAPTTS